MLRAEHDDWRTIGPSKRTELVEAWQLVQGTLSQCLAHALPGSQPHPPSLPARWAEAVACLSTTLGPARLQELVLEQATLGLRQLLRTWSMEGRSAPEEQDEEGEEAFAAWLQALHALYRRLVDLPLAMGLVGGPQQQEAQRTCLLAQWHRICRLHLDQCLGQGRGLAAAVASYTRTRLTEALDGVEGGHGCMDVDTPDPWAVLEELELLEFFLPHLIAALQDVVEGNMRAHCPGCYEGEGRLAACAARLDVPTLHQALPPLARTVMESMLPTTYFRLRLEELFDLVQDYPESRGAWQDLAQCMGQVAGGRDVLLANLRRDVRHRLLHYGASTPTILRQYAALIRSLEVLDPSGYLLEVIGPDVCAYLRRRPDAKRCVLSLLVGEEGEEGAGIRELLEDESSSSHEAPLAGDGAEAQDFDAWMPATVEAEMMLVRSRSMYSVASRLISIFDQVAVLAAEFQLVLAERLLASPDFTADDEVAYLEILKSRLGEASLSRCEVMLKDVADSRRSDALMATERAVKVAGGRAVNGQQEKGEHIPLRALHLSYQYWPEAPAAQATLVLPPRVQEALRAHQRAHRLLKPSQALHWQPHLGRVEVEVERDDGTLLTACVTPAEATALLFVQEAATQAGDGGVCASAGTSLAQLAERMRLSEAQVRLALGPWTRAGIVEEGPARHHYRLARAGASSERQPEGEEEGLPRGADEDDHATSQPPPAEPPSLGNVMITNFIIGMLTNQGAVPLDMLHRMVCMLVPDARDRSREEVKAILATMMAEERVQLVNGTYALKSG